ncbi:heat shock-binding protein 70, ER luminal protein (macronuclear) [Tetrahymena thermophila SB210]|uniref:Heat shock-binding protein 70, ER luminal protein n=1 Tax=Tetrahymena thermophila (strain SB210) TaxID=312017 RepID=I7MLP7_TETTS|nr:heat shock-binding protein 70, ER luminal protein [Tetrahymena thermophila SB210]EAS02826.2 heat shock-binding protein 70, ER luminal protein [Tetrahymena thermophila SB210]|eukprot:XP_001023071.2 heat shock-binding protein 70, ER luminal protein [Tetrahymena thermophila SB210]
MFKFIGIQNKQICLKLVIFFINLKTSIIFNVSIVCQIQKTVLIYARVINIYIFKNLDLNWQPIQFIQKFLQFSICLQSAKSKNCARVINIHIFMNLDLNKKKEQKSNKLIQYNIQFNSNIKMNSKLLFLTIIILQFYFINSEDLKDHIAIDFGNTYSSVVIVQGGKVIIIPNEFGNTETPSVVSFAEDKIFVGEQAIHQYKNNPSRSVQKIKKLIAQDQKDIVLQNSQDFLSQNITKNNRIYDIIDIEGSEVHKTEEVTAMILSKMKQIAENFLGNEIKYAILSFPTYLSDAQKQTMVNAASIAGLEVKRFFNDYKAAIHSYDLEDQNDKNALVFHLGGATMEVSILNIDYGVIDNIASCSDINFGGEVFDQRVVEYFIKLILQKYGKDISIDQIAIQKLRIEVEAAKKQLSSLLKTQIKIQNLVDGLDFSEELTREKFEEINTDLFQKVTNTIQDVLNKSGLNKIDIDNIILIGGSTYIPKIRKSIQEFFGKEPKVSIKPNEAVAIGLASQFDVIQYKNDLEILLQFEVNPISLGIETDDGIMSILIPKQSYLPYKKTEKFIFNQDNQQQKLRLKIFQGERLLTKDNFFIDELELKIPQIQQGKIEVEITAQIEWMGGLVNITAVEKSTNVMNSITFQSNPIKPEIQAFEDLNYEAMLFQFKDQITKEKINSKNSLKSYLDFVVGLLDTEEYKDVDKISNYDKQNIQQTIKEIQNWLSTNPEADKTEYELRKSNLENIFKPIFSKTQQNNEDLEYQLQQQKIFDL